MQLFIWDNVDNATLRYHDDGGIVVVAVHLDRARELIAKECTAGCAALTVDPDFTCACDGPEHIVVFPDAGCC